MPSIPLPGSTFTFSIPLVSQASSHVFQASATIAAGDFKRSINGGAFANMDNLPAVTPAAGKLVQIILSAAETTAAGEGGTIDIIGSDAAGAEWDDISIHVRVGVIAANAAQISGDEGAADNAEKFFDGTGYAGTNNVIPTVTTLTNMPAASNDWSAGEREQLRYRLQIDGTQTAPTDTDLPAVNVTTLAGQTEPLDNLVLALGTGGLVEKLNSMLEAAGLVYRFTAEALAEAPSGGSGSGTGTYTDTIKDPSNNPLDGARVQLSTDAAGAHRVYEAFTNALGVFVMNPDPGTYYRWIDLAGYTDRLTQGAQVTVT